MSKPVSPISCGCKVVGNSYPFEIKQCPLHAAAPELLEAAKTILNGWQSAKIPSLLPEQEKLLRLAIQHAEGR